MAPVFFGCVNREKRRGRGLVVHAPSRHDGTLHLVMPALVQPAKWWISPRPDAAAPLRLWCLAHAGGGAAVWHPWAARLAGVAEVVAARLPGRETRLAEPLRTRLEPLLEPLLEEFATHAPKPYVLCGHSLGGLMAFELTRRLRSAGGALPQALIVSGIRAPHLPPREPPIHGLPTREFVHTIEERYGAIPEEIRSDSEVLELVLPPLRADMEVYETYRYASAPPLDLPILALGGVNDQIVSREDVLGWRAHTTGRFETAFFAGGHFFPQEQLEAVTARVRLFLGTV
jgi:medium-chain acyl-[acyl-carrier-protein] hydrolase